MHALAIHQTHKEKNKVDTVNTLQHIEYKLGKQNHQMHGVTFLISMTIALQTNLIHNFLKSSNAQQYLPQLADG